MRTQFNNQLEQLHLQLIEMGALCEEAISVAIHELLDNDSASPFSEDSVGFNIILNKKDCADKVSEIEREINQKERDIEALCMKMILRQQPVASDLRMISSALKMITDMERIGDQAADIFEITKFIVDDSIDKGHIKDMAFAAIKMVTDSVDSFVKNDLNLAHDVIEQDDIVDRYFDMVKEDLITMIKNEVVGGEQSIDLLMIAKYLERIGDHAVNISERVIYSITGKQAEKSSSS